MKTSAPDHFNAIAERYATSEVHASSPSIRRLHELLGPKRIDAICDVACGPGHLALSFAGNASRIIGIDAAPNMLRHFERMAKERGVIVEAIQADAQKIPLPPDSLDVVVSRLAPHHFPDPARALREMVRLAKPDGRVAVIDLEGYEDPNLDAFYHELEVLHDSSHVKSYTGARWQEMFAASGLIINSLEAGGTELPGGLAVSRWCEIGNTPRAAQQKIRAKLASASKELLSGLGIRFDLDEFYIPVRTLIIIGCKA
jgi:SAM-dependent methyltransferase